MIPKGQYIACPDCGKRILNGYREGQRCRECYVTFSKIAGPRHHNFKTGRYKTTLGYIMVRVYDHPFANRSGRIYEHRLVMEKVLGRYLKPTESVHHLNGRPDDNRPENLALCQSQKEHMTHHKEVMVRVGRHAQSLRWKGYVKPNCTECGKPALAKSLCRSCYNSKHWREVRRHRLKQCSTP